MYSNYNNARFTSFLVSIRNIYSIVIAWSSPFSKL